MIAIDVKRELQFVRRQALHDPVLSDVALDQRSLGRSDQATLPVDRADGTHALGVAAQGRDVPFLGNVHLIGELLMDLVVALQRDILAMQEDYPRFGMQEEPRLVGRRSLIEHHDVVESLFQRDYFVFRYRHDYFSRSPQPNASRGRRRSMTGWHRETPPCVC